MSRFAPKSIRIRIALGHTVTLSVVVAIYSLILYLLFQRSLYSDLDVKLRNDLENTDDVLIEVLDGRASSLPREPENWLTEVWTVNGERVATTGIRDEFPLGQFDGECVESQKPQNVTLDGGIAVRVFCQDSSAKRGTYILRVARSRERIEFQLSEFLTAMFVGLPLVIVLSAVLGYLLARRSLEPIAKMTSAAQRLSASRLGERLPIDDPRDELGRLAKTFNSVFENLERSFHQMRRFSADAAHELRTPLTAIRALGEVALRNRSQAGVKKDPYETIESTLEEADRLSGLCESLLLLSRADAGQIKLHSEVTRLVPLATSVVELLEILAEEKGQRLALEFEGDPAADVDAKLLKQALTNLVDNAIKHSPSATEIRIEIRADTERARLAVIDQGPGIPAEHQAHVFERFYRVDPGRSRTDGRGAGLGLAITRWIVELHGGRISLSSSPGKGCHFEIELPRR